MIDLSKYLKGFQTALKKDITVKVIMAAGLIGMVLILISQFKDTAGQRSPQNESRSKTIQASEMSAEEYTDMLEARLEEFVGSIQGVGRARVMVTLEHGVEYVYAQEERSSLDRTSQPVAGEPGRESLRQDTQYSYVLIDSEFGKRQPLVRTQRQPKVQGVVVVCEGADNILVQEKLINVVTTALNIPTTRVCVVKIDQ